MELTDLKATIRKSVGNGPARALRREGIMPAVLYGPKTEPLALSVATADVEQAVKKSRGGQVLVNLAIADGPQGSRTVMIKELQRRPVSGNYLHVDFYEIDMNRKIKVKVPVTTTGSAVGIERGGLLQLIRHELEIFCLPLQIPEVIELDISDLDIGESIHVEEIPVAPGIEIPSEVNFTVATILSPKVEAKADVEGEEEAEEGTEGAAETDGED